MCTSVVCLHSAMFVSEPPSQSHPMKSAVAGQTLAKGTRSPRLPSHARPARATKPGAASRSIGNTAFPRGRWLLLGVLAIAHTASATSPPVPPVSPLPPAGPPPLMATVGDDPMFVGGDGVIYEVRGEGGVVSNLVSAEHLSINSRFADVPRRFRAVDITDTALGDVGVAICEGGRLTAFTLATDGRLTFVADGGASYSMEHERLVCDLSTLTCNTWQPMSDTPLQLPLYDAGHSRIKLHTAVADITITRDVMIDLGPDFPIECDDFARWPGAYAACKTLSRGETLVNATAMVHTLTGLTLRPEHRWHFMQIGLSRLKLKHGELHGLLGHRALLPGPTTSSTVRVGVGVDGAAAPAAFGPAFGPQGEGVIEGHYTDYERPRLHEHGGLRFGRFVCGAGCNTSSCAVADASEV
jgi:hypothetical protein